MREEDKLIVGAAAGQREPLEWNFNCKVSLCFSKNRVLRDGELGKSSTRWQ